MQTGIVLIRTAEYISTWLGAVPVSASSRLWYGTGRSLAVRSIPKLNQGQIVQTRTTQ